MFAFWPSSWAGILLSLSVALGPGFSKSVFAAQTNPDLEISGICLKAARTAAIKYGVPVSVLTAITLTETGRHRNNAFSPWPWATNVGGVGNWFANRVDAEKYIHTQYENGRKNFDVGCFQINYRRHGYKFGSPVALFDPAASAEYAAQMIKTLYEETGDWSKAAGAYHSRTPKFATRYRKRFDEIRNARMHLDANPYPDVGPTTVHASIPRIKENKFPLLKRGTSVSAGSLFNRPLEQEISALNVFGSRGRLWDD